MNVNELMERYSLSRTDLANKFRIPYRTVQNWSLGIRNCPEYVLRMMLKILENGL